MSDWMLLTTRGGGSDVLKFDVGKISIDTIQAIEYE